MSALFDASHLSADDLSFIAKKAVPVGLREDLLTTCEERVIFTPKGLAFYTAACSYYGLTFSVSGVKTLDDAFELNKKIRAAALSASRKDLEAAVCSGDLKGDDADFVRSLFELSAKNLRVEVARQRARQQGRNGLVGVIGINKVAD